MAAPTLTAALLVRPARRTARLMARAYLQRVLEEAAHVEIRVAEITGPGALRGVEREREAVHDLRVALRRLRSWLRAWRPYLRDTVRRSSERRLQRLSRLAGAARDLEVQRAWLASNVVRRAPAAGEAARLLLLRIEAEYAAALRALARGLLRELGPAAARLDAELEEQEAGGPLQPGEPTMAFAMARLIDAHTEEAVPFLRRTGAGDARAAHAARIAVKRLRYLVDSLSRHSPDLRLVDGYLIGLQDELGELHDAQVLLARLAEGSGGAGERRRAKGPALPRSGRPALRALLRRRIAAEFLRARRAIAGPGLPRALRATARVIDRLDRMDEAAHRVR
jgi:CHAD domain-containing protein